MCDFYVEHIYIHCIIDWIGLRIINYKIIYNNNKIKKNNMNISFSFIIGIKLYSTSYFKITTMYTNSSFFLSFLLSLFLSFFLSSFFFLTCCVYVFYFLRSYIGVAQIIKHNIHILSIISTLNQLRATLNSELLSSTQSYSQLN